MVLAMVGLLVALLATFLGAVAGLGGGVIIKPVLDSLGMLELTSISLLSSCTVLAMSVTSTLRYRARGCTYPPQILALCLGSVAGGLAGQSLFKAAVSQIPSATVSVIQSAVIMVLLGAILFKEKIPAVCIRSSVLTTLVGLLLGMLSAFLGIGGGPINVAALCLLFSMTVRDAAVSSVLIILCSQVSNLATMALSGGMAAAAQDAWVLAIMVPAGVIGGLLGARCNRLFSERTVNRLFNGTLLLVIALCVYNIIQAIG